MDLMKPLGKRTMGLMIAILLVIMVTPTYAQRERSQVDCWGDYRAAVAGYYKEMMQRVQEAYDNFAWYDIRRSIQINEAGLDYYARAESAWLQMWQCSTIGNWIK